MPQQHSKYWHLVWFFYNYRLRTVHVQLFMMHTNMWFVYLVFMDGIIPHMIDVGGIGKFSTSSCLAYIGHKRFGMLGVSTLNFQISSSGQKRQLLGGEIVVHKFSAIMDRHTKDAVHSFDHAVCNRDWSYLHYKTEDSLYDSLLLIT